MYNRIAGQSRERLAGLSDGVFAVAMTLLVLEIRVPNPHDIHTEAELWAALGALGPRFLMFVMSFMTLGIFWSGQQTQLNFFERVDRDLSWIHLVFLAAISILPFSTSLLAEFFGMRLALGLYWLNLLAPGLLLLASWIYAGRSGLIGPAAAEGARAAVTRRIVVAQTLYAAGAALCLISPALSIAVIFLLQLFYAAAPRIGWLHRTL